MLPIGSTSRDRAATAAGVVAIATLVALALPALLVSATAQAQAQAGVQIELPPQARASEAIPDQYIVVFDLGVANPLGTAAEMARAYGLGVRHVYTAALKGFSATIPAARLQTLQADPRVAFIEQDRTVHLVAQTLPAGVDRIDADQSATAKIDGIDDSMPVDVAIIDTGIDSDHPDLRVGTGVNCIGTGGPEDDNGHGTHVAGTVAAIDNGSHVVGVAPGATVRPVKVLDASGSGSFSSVACGVDWVTANAGSVAVANMSLGAQAQSSSLRTAIQNSVAAGVYYAVAAGNDGRDIYGTDGVFGTSDDFIPAAYPEVAAVSAMADFDGQAGGAAGRSMFIGCGWIYDDTIADCFSNFSSSVVAGNPVISPGAAIDLAAPGVSVLSTTNNGSTGTSTGTSMASPHVAGAAALYIVANGRATDAAGVAAIRQALIDAGQPQSVWRSDSTRDPDGNLEPLVFVAGGTPPPDPDPVTDVAISGVSAPSSVTQGDVVSVDVTVTNVGNQDVGSFNVSLTDATDGVVIGTQAVGGLLAGASTTLTYSWDTTNSSAGSHTLQAGHDLVDDNTTNDSASTTVTVNEPTSGDSLTITSITPDTVQAGQSVNVTISGTGFAAGASVTLENGSGPGPTVSNVVVVDANTITATISTKSGGPPRNRVWDVRVTHPDNATAVLAGGFTITP